MAADKETDDFELIETGADEELLNVLADIGESDTVNVKVYRVKKGSKSLTFLFECLPHEFSLAYVRDNYGSGDYRIQVRDGSKLQANKLIGIEALPQLPTAYKHDASDDTIKEMLGMLQSQGKEQKDDFKQMMAQNMQMMMAIIASNGKQAAPATPPMTLTDMVQAFASVATLLKGNAAPASDPQGFFDIFMKGMDMARDLQAPTNGAETNDVLVKMIEQFGPIFAQAQSVQQGATTMPTTRPAITQQRTHPQHIQHTQEQTEGDDMYQMAAMMIRPKLRDLCEVAARAGNIDLYSDFVLDQVPPAYLAMLFEEPDPVAFLASIEPTINTYRPWFEALLANINAILSEESLTHDAESDSQPQTGEVETASNVVAIPVEEKPGGNAKPDGENNQDT